jgi:hypothetical protein
LEAAILSRTPLSTNWEILSTERSLLSASPRKYFMSSLRRVRIKPAAPMHLKSDQIDGRLLRTGAADFSASGLKRQDNDLIVIERMIRFPAD